ncbi:MAG: cupin domain-containing protein [Candidatus Obscuribacterales bacterium]|nr:cupin domain-containing protein [Candidatus Obscuribacterales bacterium]
MEIIRAGTQASVKGPSEWFTGDVRIDPLVNLDDPARVQAASVTFEPEARTAWHTHPLGQTIIVTSGCGIVQEEGQQAQIIKPGDIVWTPPEIKHWHGALPSTSMTHLVIVEKLNGKAVEWMDHVNDDQYKSGCSICENSK